MRQVKVPPCEPLCLGVPLWCRLLPHITDSAEAKFHLALQKRSPLIIPMFLISSTVIISNQFSFRSQWCDVQHACCIGWAMQNKVGLHGVRDIAPWILNILNTSQLGAPFSSTFPRPTDTCLAVLQERQEHLMALESSGAVLSDPFQNRWALWNPSWKIPSRAWVKSDWNRI
jgi:hypothetical protein